MIVLASQSASRRALLSAAQVPFEALSPGVDEEAAKDALRADGLDARALADALAELKARKVSRRGPGALVLGCDQTLSLDGGEVHAKAVSKPLDCAHSGAVIVLKGEPIWRHIERVRMTVRPLSDAFIAAYLDGDWDECRWCVGCYRIEGPGAQLFAKVEGSQFAIQGLPLLPLLNFLRVRGVLTA